MTTVQKPAMTVIGTAGKNIWTGQGLTRKLAVVTHIMAGTLAGCDTWFSNPAAQASANYGVGKDGSIHQYVDPEGSDAPYANGLVNNPDAAFRALAAVVPGTNPNDWTVSIEHEGQSGDALTPSQLAASSQLCAWLCQRFSIPADEAHILGHYEIDSVTRAHCPGWNRGTWLLYVAAVTAAIQPAPQPTPDPRDQQIEALQQAVQSLTVERDAARSLLSALLHRAQDDEQTIMAQGVS